MARISCLERVRTRKAQLTHCQMQLDRAAQVLSQTAASPKQTSEPAFCSTTPQALRPGTATALLTRGCALAWAGDWTATEPRSGGRCMDAEGAVAEPFRQLPRETTCGMGPGGVTITHRSGRHSLPVACTMMPGLRAVRWYGCSMPACRMTCRVGSQQTQACTLPDAPMHLPAGQQGRPCHHL